MTLLYGSLFLVAGASLLAITYGLVSQNGTAGQDQALISFNSRLPGGLKGKDGVFVRRGAVAAGAIDHLPQKRAWAQLPLPAVERVHVTQQTGLARRPWQQRV